MSDGKPKNEGFDGVLQAVRQMRDTAVDAWAKSTLRVTSSRPYQKVQGMVMKPTLIATALWREATETVMAAVLSQLNMPSRDELLQVSKRLTRIEMTLDDLGAALDELRRDEKKPARAQRAASRERDREPLRESTSTENGASAASSASASD
jgi:hypothetical protein